MVICKNKDDINFLIHLVLFLNALFPVQVMALIAYLMEFKGNYGPHLIIVPNAVLVNWKVGCFLVAY